jgi:DivIVA domain-containing protein
MDKTPSQVSGATFRSSRKGYDPEEVDAFLGQVAEALEAAQQQATAMEARARAAVARLQEMQAAHAGGSDAAESGEVHVSQDQVETISRTLLLAQRTADATVSEAKAEADRLLSSARSEAERIRSEAQTEAEATIDSTRAMSAQLLEEARTEARKATERERVAAENEVEALKARREFLLGDVDQLEQFLIDQRERLRGAARQLEALCDRVPSGLGQVPPPILSAAGDETAELLIPEEANLPFASADELAEALDDDAVPSFVGDELPVTDDEPNVDPSAAPQLPARRESSSSD